MRPKSAVCLRNDSGTAPGIHWHNGGKHIIAMPGPRNEFSAMLTNAVDPILESLSNSTIRSRTIRIIGMPEAQLGEMFAKEMECENPTVSPYAKVGEVHLRITARAETAPSAEALIEPVLSKIVSQIGDHVYTTSDDDLAKVVLDKLTVAGRSLAVAESCTGGLLGARLTSVPGSSASFAGGIISYSDMVKANVLHVVPEDLEKFGAVSEEVARQMAINVCSVLGSSYGLSVTGIAGPTGATDKKPVGLVFVGCAGPSVINVEEHRFRGGREHIRELSVQRSLALLWREVRYL
jgi:nicotinamide-nucleotide amidase